MQIQAFPKWLRRWLPFLWCVCGSGIAVACIPGLPGLGGVTAGESEGSTTTSLPQTDVDDGPGGGTTHSNADDPTSGEGAGPGPGPGTDTQPNPPNGTGSSSNTGTTASTSTADTHGDWVASTSGGDSSPEGPISLCGNGQLDVAEQCDGAELLGLDCRSLGLDGGVLSCDAITCTFDTSMCTSIGGGTGG